METIIGKYIFVTGGVVSSLGKGLASASIGNLMESRGLKITFLKLDPYINVDPGTMNPYQHGEVYVTDDGAETDLDLGHYERYTSLTLTKENNDRPYLQLCHHEGAAWRLSRRDCPGCAAHYRRDQAVHHADLPRDGRDHRGIGGTVGDIESLPFLEAIRQMPYDVGRENVLYVHLTLVPYIGAAGELKTKPTQHSVNKLREIGIQPNILCRTDRYIPPEMKAKIAMFCNVEKDAVITAKDVETIYEVPIVFRKEGLDELIVRLLKLETGPPNLREWDAMVQKIKHPKHEIAVALVGKYAGLKECYKSLAEALVHGGIDHETRVNITWIESEEYRTARDRTDSPRGGWHSYSRRLRLTRDRGQNHDDPVCAGTPGSVSGVWACSARPSSSARVAGLSWRQQRRVRRALASSGHSLDAGSTEHKRQGRHHAAGQLPLPAG